MGDGEPQGERAERTEKYEKSTDYEALLADFNERIAELEPPARECPHRPTTFIVGVPRSGTTLLYQVLAATGGFGYPSNLAARFFRAPWIGARVERILEPVLERRPFTFASNAGLTDPWYEPHEFGYFWERHFPFDDHHELSEGFGRGGAREAFRREVGAFEKELGAPLLFKNVLLDYAVDLLARWLPEVHVVHIRRDPLLVAQSLYRTRIEYYGRADAWFSVRPEEADELESASPARQIAVQIRSALEALEASRREGDAADWTELSYEDLCRAPREIASTIVEISGDEGRASVEELPATFSARTERRLDEAVLERLAGELDRQGIEAT